MDCSQLRALNLAVLENHVRNNPKIIIGELTTEDLELVRQRIISSEILKGKVKRKLGFYD